ncbi:glycosyltransferase family 25 protein [Brucella pseudogrignonensis]|uniref:glycosyltransferase family 25 protein n=1 Tax=Brucella pseudogrignonensis TaxID=419475 RepID=UPI0028B3BB42|nr:glycosyltransferase family 25 protein [Brucella pseudogrignonensis]MDT6941107.1 glycosyltransferase family 25 protein [Brucella pseudogrignonensis]
MNCYLINLDRSRDRLEFMAAQFEKHGLRFERVEAVDGRALSEAELASCIKLSKNWPIPLGPTEIGCFLSHRRCIAKAAESEDEFTAIFEDDVTFSNGAARLLSSYKWIPTEAEIVKIDAYGYEVLISRPVSTEGPYAVTRLLSRHLQTGGYIISRIAAQRLIKLMDKVPAPVDHFLFDPDDGPFNQLNIYQITPAICWQSGLQSTIGGNRPRKSRPSFAKLIWRESIRLVSRTKRNSIGAWMNLTKTGQWGPIPRDKDIG